MGFVLSGTIGFSQNLDWEMGIGSPLQGPLIKETKFTNVRPS